MSICRDTRNKPSPPEVTLADKFRQVEKSLSEVLDSIGSGEKPDPSLLSQLQATIAEGKASEDGTQIHTRRASTLAPTEHGDSPTSSNENGDGSTTTSSRRTKRARYGSVSASSVGPFDSPQCGIPLALSPQAPAPPSASSAVSSLPPISLSHGSTSSHPPRQMSLTPSHPSPSHPSPSGTSGSLSMLADASLAAQIDGRSRLTGLDPSFKLSTVTNAIQRKDENGFGTMDGEEMRAKGTTPAVLSKGIVTPELAVELFTM